MSTSAVVAVLSLAPGPGVPADLVEQVHAAVVRELADAAIGDTGGRLRSVDGRTGTRARFSAAQDRVRRLRVEFPDDALEAAREAAAAAEDGFLPLTDPGLVVEALVAQGAMELDARHPAAARKAFALAVDLQPSYRPDPARVSPPARKLFGEVTPPDCAALDTARLLRAVEALGADRLLVLRSCPEGGRVLVVASEISARGPAGERAVTVALGSGLEAPDARRLAGLPAERERRWYGHAWVWAVVGAAAVAAVVIPLSTRDETGDVRVHW